MRTWRPVKASVLALVAAAILALPSLASAALFVPTGNQDLSDLEHHHMYTWRIVTGMGGQNITGATLTFNRMYNWNDQENRLYIHLLNNARYDNVAGFVDDTGDNDVSRIDHFASPNFNAFQNQTGWLIDAGMVSTQTGNHYLTSREFAGPGEGPLGNFVTNGQPGWSVQNVAQGLYTYRYEFNALDLAALNAYIADGVIALGLDPDCHYFNTGISLDLRTSTIPSVPEPASLVLLGSGLALARRFRRTRTRQ